MAIKDIVSDLIQFMALALSAIVSNTTTVGIIIDTADFELGLMYAIDVSDYTDGTYVLLLEESDDSGMAGAVPITGDKLLGTLPSVSAATGAGANLEKVGVISNLRYVRASIVSTSVTTGADVSVIGTEKAELSPV